jgi:hypothetical protein
MFGNMEAEETSQVYENTRKCMVEAGVTVPMVRVEDHEMFARYELGYISQMIHSVESNAKPSDLQ